MWRQGSRSAALDRAQGLLSSRGNSKGVGPFPPGETWHQSVVPVSARSAPSNTHTLPSEVSDLSSVSSTSDDDAARKIHEHTGGSSAHLRPQTSLAGELADGGGSRFLKKKAVPPDDLSRQNSQLVSQSQLKYQQPQSAPHLRGSQTAALSRLADLESRIRSRKQARPVLKPASDQRPSLGPSAASPPPPSAAGAAQPFGLSLSSSNEHNMTEKRFFKSNRAADVKTCQRTGPGCVMGFRLGDADGTERSVGTEMIQMAGVSLESDEEDMKELLGDCLNSISSSLKPARPESYKTAKEQESRQQGHSVSTIPYLPSTVPQSPASSTSSPTPRSPASPFRYTGHTQAHFSSSANSPPLSSPRASPSRVGSPQRPLSSMSSNSVILSLAELFPVEPQDHHSVTTLASMDGFKNNALTLDDLVSVKLDSTGETTDMEVEQKSAFHGQACQQRHQQRNYNQEKAANFESDFESESRRTEVKEVRLSERQQGQNDNEEEADPVSEITDEVSKGSRGGEEVLYSDTFSDLSSSFTSRSPDCSVERPSRTSRSSERQKSTRKLFKDAVVQTQLALPTSRWTSGLPPTGGQTFPHPTPVITHLSAETVEAIGSFNPSAFVLTELLKQQLAATKRFIESNRQLHDGLLRSLEPPDYRYTTLEDTQELIRKQRLDG